MTPQPPVVPQHIQIELARRELKALQAQQSIAKYGIELLSNTAMEFAGTGGDASILQNLAAELEADGDTERAREVQRIAGRLRMIDTVGDKPNRVMFSALVALVLLRLQELKNSHAAIEPRIAELEGALRIADSGIVRPVRT